MNANIGLKAAAKRGHTTSVFFEMLRSFCTLGRNLNLSKTVDELGISRQTVRRHINDLQELRGTTLINFDDRKYSLTDDGSYALAEAERLLSRADNWMNNTSGLANGLAHISTVTDDGVPFHAQRHPITDICSNAPDLIKQGFAAWSASSFDIESEAMKAIRPYLIGYRKNRGDWICTFVGEHSSYASWRGWAWAKSAVGSIFERDPISTEADAFILEAYENVMRTGAVWYDHISTKFVRNEDQKLTPVNYQRLVMCCRFPNGELNIASLVARTNKIRIDGLDLNQIEMMPEEDVMEFSVAAQEDSQPVT